VAQDKTNLTDDEYAQVRSIFDPIIPYFDVCLGHEEWIVGRWRKYFLAIY